MGTGDLLVDVYLGSIVTLDFVPKMRDTDHYLSYYDFFISVGSIVVSPIPTTKK